MEMQYYDCTVIKIISIILSKPEDAERCNMSRQTVTVQSKVKQIPHILKWKEK